ncbi:hypothetical protein FE394_13975 [Xenorhabdus sp. Reich]|uniref:B3/B4 tRNA-binding domain-containing protein n=1 Tax=Xenorhabdus littoralis TaxID=2582835 RepID=A0ABU4SNP7_9GAMM|nr:phenylalanine--tRNA ligase beta subunit-related protein [Xenorhabdus sp. Reich]MDX8000273.1 hypothetical protein [Xenorhabdus sp. Reich]
MKLLISDDVFSIFPEMEIHGVIFHDIDLNSVPNISFDDITTIDNEKIENELIIWKDVYKRFPRDKKAKVSIDYLFKAIRNGKLKKISSLVDIYNYASLISYSPFGGECLHSMKDGELALTIANGEEIFQPLFSNDYEKPLSGEIIWRFGHNDVVCRSMNFKESDKFKITDSTNSVIFLSEKPFQNMQGEPESGINFLLSSLSNVSKSYLSFNLNSNNSYLYF